MSDSGESSRSDPAALADQAAGRRAAPRSRRSTLAKRPRKTKGYETVTTRGLVLRRYDFGDTSQIAHVLGVEEGRVSVLAKGIKKPNPNLKGPFDLFQWGELSYRRRAGSEIALATRFEPLTGFRGLRRRLDRFYAGAYLVDLVYEFARDGDAQAGLLALTLDGLARFSVATPRSLPGLLLATELAVLDETGFAADIGACPRCGGKSGERRTRFVPSRGAFFCETCSGGLGLPCQEGTRRALATLAGEGFAAAEVLRLETRQWKESRSLMRAWIQQILEKPLRSERFLASP